MMNYIKPFLENLQATGLHVLTKYDYFQMTLSGVLQII